jgi:large subunit ribosomal protein L21
MFAIIKTGGKQYRVQEGDFLEVEKLQAEPGKKFHFSQVLLIGSGKETMIGTPLVEKALVRAEVVDNFKDEKIIVFKKKRRKQFRRTRGHRQEMTRVKIERIIPDSTAVPAEEVVGEEAKVEEAAPRKAVKEAEEKAAPPAEKKLAKREAKIKEKKAAEAPEKKGRKAKAKEKEKTKAAPRKPAK